MWVYNSNSELYHHGILGMKWGRRKSGGSTSTSTDSSRRKTSSMSDEELTNGVKRMSLEKTYNSLAKENRKPSKLEKTKKVVDATSTGLSDWMPFRSHRF